MRTKPFRRRTTAILATLALAATTWLVAAPGSTAAAQTNSPIGFASVNAMGQNGTTGGAGGQTVTASNTAEFLDYISRSEPLVIRVQGTISLPAMERVSSNKSILGVGSSATITGGGLMLTGVQNVIIRNLNFVNNTIGEGDAIDIQSSTHHVWVDHNTFRNQADGAVDIKRESSYITVSWNHFDGTDKSMLLGHSDSHTADVGFLRVTYHHNWFNNSNTRHPRVRFGDPVHVFNNYYLNNNEYGVASTMDAGVLVEGNYFQGVSNPTHVGYASSGPGRLVERNNVYSNSGQPETAGSVTEPSTFYSYPLDNAANVPGIVSSQAGAGQLDF